METENPVVEQPSGDSATEDRIASIFGGGDPEPAEQPDQAASEPAGQETEAAPADETFELDIDGEKYTLPKKLEKGFMQEKDYTQKSQSLAEQRRALDVQLHQQRIAQFGEQFRKDTEKEQQQMQLLDWALSQPINWQAMTTDDAFRKKIELDDLRDQKAKLEKAIEEKRTEWGRKQQEELSKLRSTSLDAISKRIPGWSDATAKAIREHALNEGYTDTELNSILDPRHVTTLWKAQQYDLLKAKATPAVAATKAVKTTPSNPMPPKVRDDLNFRKAAQKAQGDKKFASSGEFQNALQSRIASKFGA